MSELISREWVFGEVLVPHNMFDFQTLDRKIPWTVILGAVHVKTLK